MFDTVHRPTRRGPRLVPLLASVFVNSIACAIVVVAAQSRAIAVVDPPDDTVEVMVPLHAPAAIAPVVPRPSGRPKAGATSPKAAPELAAPPAPLAPPSPPTPESGGTFALTTSGQTSGEGTAAGNGGAADGNGGSGNDDGPPGGSADTIRTVHWSEARLLHACDPAIPDVMRQLGRTEEQCVVNVTLAADGRVADATPASCPTFLQAEAIRAATCSTFAGVGEPVRFRFRYVFRLN